VLADAVTAVLEGEFPVVLGGDCSIVLGAMLALRRRGGYGLLYIDGDADYYQPEVNPLSGAASASGLLAGVAVNLWNAAQAPGDWVNYFLAALLFLLLLVMLLIRRWARTRRA
jgi:arginase family enzyme